MNTQTDLLPVYMPDTIVIETKENFDGLQINKEILELYFSNRKRSGGENLKNVKFSSRNNRVVYVTFRDGESKYKQYCGENIRVKAFFLNWI